MGQQKGVPAQKIVQVRLDDPSDVRILFCNHMEVMHTATEFMVTFAQVIPPSVKSEEEFTGIVFAEGKVIARFSMTPAMLRNVIKALQENLEKYDLIVKEASHAHADAETDR